MATITHEDLGYIGSGGFPFVILSRHQVIGKNLELGPVKVVNGQTQIEPRHGDQVFQYSGNRQEVVRRAVGISTETWLVEP